MVKQNNNAPVGGLMSKATGTFFAALILIACTPYAHADSITDGTINFTVGGGGPAPTGSFVYDSTTSTFASFTVNWDGAVFDFADTAITLGQLSTEDWCAQAPNNITGPCIPGTFSLSGPRNLGGTFTGPEAQTFTDPSAGALGTYTITETPVPTTPEPGSLVLMLFGVAALGFFSMRRRAICGSR